MKTSKVFVIPLIGLALGGCVNVKAPERIDIGGGPRSADVDSSNVPEPRSLDEARVELRKAYQQIRYLEDKVDDLEKDKRDLKEDREKYKRRAERYEDD